ncbi:MAG: PEP-CTERM sorting domain-containing protein [Gammaproteobacteria bacterium]|nr:PEP-CTERM sorting domain-containing protein [Gammaproteobacteria bacterium]
MTTSIFSSAALALTVFASLSVSAPALASTITTGLTAYWSFDEGAGNIAGDSSGNNFDGTINGATWTSGISGSALYFDGVNDTVNYSGFGMTGETSFSVSAWVNRSLTNGNNCCGQIVGQRNNNAWSLRYDNRDNKPVEFIVTPSWQGDNGNQGASIAADEWHHITGVLDTNLLNLYVDGILEHSMSYAGSVGGGGAYGAIGGALDGYFHGVIDEVRIYDRALTAADVNAVMADATGTVPEPSVLALMGLGIFGLGLARRKMK